MVGKMIKLYPQQLKNVMQIEMLLRTKWDDYCTKKKCTLMESIKNFQDEDRMDAFLMKQVYLNPLTSMISQERAFTGGKNSMPSNPFGKDAPTADKRSMPSNPFGKDAPSGRAAKRAKKDQKQPSPKKDPKQPALAPVVQPMAGADRNPQTSFVWRHPVMGSLCYAGASRKGCKRQNCQFAATHGMCPLPQCNFTVHCAEEKHPKVWAADGPAGRIQK